jgi:hypothetical protein
MKATAASRTAPEQQGPLTSRFIQRLILLSPFLSSVRYGRSLLHDDFGLDALDATESRDAYELLNEHHRYQGATTVVATLQALPGDRVGQAGVQADRIPTSGV